jgi:hypothetical protein
MLLGNYHLSAGTGQVGLPRSAVRKADCLRIDSSDRYGSFALTSIAREAHSWLILGRGTIPLLTAIPVLLFCIRCFNQQRLSRVAEGTGPMKPQQPGASAKVLIPAQVGRDKILD